MTKTERMVNLINLIKSKEVVTVQDMSREFGISQRTVYRDLNTLSKMNIPIYYEDGYRLGQDSPFDHNGLNIEEKELIRFSLRQNPLSADPYLSSKFKEIEEKIFESTNDRMNGTKKIFVWETDGMTYQSIPKAGILNNFVRAIIDNNKISLNLKNHSSKPVSYIPVAVKMKRDGTYVVVQSDRNNPSQDISINEIESLGVTAEKFNHKQGELLQVIK